MKTKALNPKLNFVAGISPQYWSYVGMSVMDVSNLKLRDGLNWLPSPPSNADFVSPVSKCLLVGYIVYVAERKGGCMVYILDDGTGLIDCVNWPSNIDSNAQDPYNLPSLACPLDDEEHRDIFQVGDLVRVFGKIECLASTTKSKTTFATTQEGKRRKGNTDDGCDETSIVREIHANIIEPVENYGFSEAHHWIDSSRLDPVDIRSCLDAVGPKIRLQIDNRVDLPAADDKLFSWRVFGVSCSCNLSYMEDLLYCHCQAKAEPMDPLYRFRDALLHKLLSMQSRMSERLEFKYKQIINDADLQAVALKDFIAEERTDKKDTINKLFLKTFRALRCDGVVYLLDSDTDEYLLITRTKVLEPFIRSQMEGVTDSSKTMQHFVSYNKAPEFISRVHNERLLYIKRLLIGHKEETSTT